ncbi:hypothetical protein DUNSADRAFT_8146 [Dunaliella salina]|uniref:Encoded protein n=1 Tax=Dunaliella salina TaxID=3046 RepID=A0ABQ7GJX6_DUNSA|nr:hypothetical protein DUNSADRAFT_8146 [Dunaliella salina]|eukprot:KAF5834920.1 hypothetical protein DUNSADRAFT_8146 [Dunaliella salina]
MLSHRQDYSPPMPGEDNSNEQELQMEIDRLCSGPNAQRVPRPPASSKEKLLRFRVCQRIKSVLERCDRYQASFTPLPGPSPQESSGNHSKEAAASEAERGKPCRAHTPPTPSDSPVTQPGGPGLTKASKEQHDFGMHAQGQSSISSNEQASGFRDHSPPLQPPKVEAQANKDTSSGLSLRLWQQQQLMKMRDMQRQEVMGLQESACSSGGQGQASEAQTPAHSFEPIRLAFQDTTNRFNGTEGLEATLRWHLHKREGLTNRERLQAGMRDLAGEFYGTTSSATYGCLHH